MFTFPVSSISMVRKNGKFLDEEFAEWAIKHNIEWSDSNLFIDEDVSSLSNCCRLKSNIRDLGYFNSIGGTALKVGSVKVNTINLARLALDTNTKEEYIEELKNRIDNCDELKKDLQGACAFLIPAQYNDALDLGNELKIIDKELEQYDRADTTFAFQSLLFNHPLYENADDTIRILIAGFGVYGQQFLDICLQAGQIKDKKLEITVVTQDKEAYKKEYLDKIGKAKKILIYSAEIFGGMIALWLLGYLIYAFAMA